MCIFIVYFISLKAESLDNAIHGIWAIIPCSPNKVTVRIYSKLQASWKAVVFTNKVGKNSQYFAGVLNKTIIPLTLVGYEMIIAYLPSHIQCTIVEWLLNKLAVFIHHQQWVVDRVTLTKIAQIMLGCRVANSYVFWIFFIHFVYM